MFPEIWELQKNILVPSEINMIAILAEYVDQDGRKIACPSPNV